MHTIYGENALCKWLSALVELDSFEFDPNNKEHIYLKANEFIEPYSKESENTQPSYHRKRYQVSAKGHKFHSRITYGRKRDKERGLSMIAGIILFLLAIIWEFLLPNWGLR